MNTPEFEAVTPQMTATVPYDVITAQNTWLPATASAVPVFTFSVRGFPAAAGNDDTLTFGSVSRSTSTGPDTAAFRSNTART
jgi:hypothetical protein